MKKELQGWIKKFRETYFSPEIDLSARVFFVLVIASMLFCLIITAVNFAAGVGTVGVVVDLASAAFCALILWYARTSRRIRQCQLITIVCVFFGLFPYLYFRMGGYHGGFTAFLIFAVVYTAFMLEGWLAFGITALELLFYTGLYVVSYRYPFLVSDFPAEKDYLRSNIMDFLIVGATLCVTMYVQVRLYRKQQQRLHQQNQLLAQASLSKTEFLANASHEMKTPLTVASVNIQTVMRMLNHMGESNPETTELLADAQEEIMGLARMVSGMLSMASLSESTEKKRCSLTAILKNSTDMLRLLFRKKENELEVSVEEGMEVFADADLISQVLVNLLENAVLHGKTYTKIWIIVTHTPGRVEIAVEDDGQGIKESVLPVMFEGKISSDEEESDSKRNMGIGLSVCHSIVKAHKGGMHAENRAEGGARISFWLPMNEEDTDGY